MKHNPPIIESVVLSIKSGQRTAFLETFKQAAPLLSKQKGYLSHRLAACLEDPLQFLLTVHWQTLTDHTIGFRQSTEYSLWKKKLHPFYQPFPDVYHYQEIPND